jgi:hypothetical protein
VPDVSASDVDDEKSEANSPQSSRTTRSQTRMENRKTPIHGKERTLRDNSHFLDYHHPRWFKWFRLMAPVCMSPSCVIFSAIQNACLGQDDANGTVEEEDSCQEVISQNRQRGAVSAYLVSCNNRHCPK